MTTSPAQRLTRFIAGDSDEPVLFCPIISETLPAQWVGATWRMNQADPRMVEAKLKVGADCGFVPIVKMEMGSLGYLQADEEVLEEDAQKTVVRQFYDTPQGRLEGVFTRMANGLSADKKLIQTIDDTLKMAWVYENLGSVANLRTNLRRIVEQVGDRGAVCFNVGHPFTSFDDHVTTIFFSYEHPEEMRQVAERMCALRMKWIDAAVEAGVRIFFAGGLGGNMFSPDMIDQWMVPYCTRLREHCHRRGAIYYLHECGSMTHKLQRGVYDRILPDWLEGFEAPPVGDVENLAEARRRVAPSVVFKGNLNLEFLKDAAPVAVEERTLVMLEGLRGHRHIAGGACSLLPGTPRANLQAMGKAVARFLGQRWEEP